MDTITERQRELLKAIIHEFIQTADAVASMQLVEKYDLPVSSATIRNEMKALCEAGYLTQVHTSSGRIPTTIGLRYFIQELSGDMDAPTMILQERIKRRLHTHRFSKFGLIEEAGKALTQLTDNLTLILTSEGTHFYGLAKILEQPEFQELENLQTLMGVLEDRKILAQVLSRNKSRKPIRILIGEELGVEGLEEFAFIYTNIMLHSQQRAILLTVGPHRMNYSKVVPALQFVTSLVNHYTSKW